MGTSCCETGTTRTSRGALALAVPLAFEEHAVFASTVRNPTNAIRIALDMVVGGVQAALQGACSVAALTLKHLCGYSGTAGLSNCRCVVSAALVRGVNCRRADAVTGL